MTIDMTRHQGAATLPVAEQIDRRGVWRVRTAFQPDLDPETGEQRGVTFIETEFPYKPSLAEVKAFCEAVINAQTEQAIISGFEWDGKPVWLSKENQMNFAQAVTPVRLKIGEEPDGTPVYHEFQTQKELTAFNKEWIAHRQQQLQSGCERKDAVDYEPYKEALSGKEAAAL